MRTFSAATSYPHSALSSPRSEKLPGISGITASVAIVGPRSLPRRSTRLSWSSTCSITSRLAGDAEPGLAKEWEVPARQGVLLSQDKGRGRRVRSLGRDGAASKESSAILGDRGEKEMRETFALDPWYMSGFNTWGGVACSRFPCN